MNRSKLLDLLLYLSYIAFFISLVCSFRAISSIAIGLILMTGFIKNKNDSGAWLSMNLKNNFLAACGLFYLLQSTGLLFSISIPEATMQLQLKTAIVLVPLAICCSNYLNMQVRQKLMKYYIWMVAGGLFFCLLIAGYKYILNPDAAVFFYHELMPFGRHAVQASILLFAGLLYLAEQAKNACYFHNKLIHLLLIICFTGFVLLLSSKLVILFCAGCFTYYFFLVLKEKVNRRLIMFTSFITGLAMIILALSTQNRISQRFNEIISGDMGLIQQKKFDPGIYFNGLQFRLLQVRFVNEILTENNAWLTGVSGDAQSLLDKKYTSSNMYTGNGKKADQGYLGYNTHNQFLESLLQSGVPGLLAFILVCCALVQLAIRRKNRELSIIVLLLLMYCLNESVFETQYGIMLFTFFPLFLFYGSGKTMKSF